MIRSNILVVIKSCAIFLAILIHLPVSAATVFAPTDGDVNFITNDLSVGTLLALFDDSDTSNSNGLGILTGAGFGTLVTGVASIAADISKPGDYTASNSSGAIALTGSDWFTLAISTDGGTTWSSDTGVDYLENNTYNVYFTDGSVLEIDVRVVPVPAAVWLFGSGLLGLVGVARRKSRQVRA